MRIREGRYEPKPVRQVEIPKPDGGVRNLRIPTVIDRMIQQAIKRAKEYYIESFEEYHRKVSTFVVNIDRQYPDEMDTLITDKFQLFDKYKFI